LLKAGWEQKQVTYDSKADIWSIGVVYYQMLFGNYPFLANNIPDLIKDIEVKTNKNFTFSNKISISK